MSKSESSSILIPKCLTCGALKPRSEFHKDKKRPLGCAAKCKACKREYDNRYREENRERVRENSRRYQREHKDHKREYDKQYRADNAEHRAQLARQWYDENREHKQDYDRQRRETHYVQNKRNHKRWRDANRDHVREYGKLQRQWYFEDRAKDVRKRRARKRGAPGDGATLSELIAVHGPLCYLCGIADADSVDHVIPLSRNGTNYPENQRPCCGSCNSSKHNKTYDEYMDYLARYY